MSNVLVKIALLLLVVAFPVGKAAAQETQVGRGIICDTADQVEAFATKSVTEGAERALASVNAEAGNETACGVVLVAFVEGPEAKQVASGANIVRIVEIVIIGVNVGVGWRPTPPFKQFTMFLIEGRAT